MPVDYSKYPKDWKSKIRPDILRRAKNKCENCGVENYTLRDGSKIVLTISHTDHDISNNDYSNLMALCQRCHIRHDKHLHYCNSQVNLIKKLDLRNTNPMRLELLLTSIENYINAIEDKLQKNAMVRIFLQKEK